MIKLTKMPEMISLWVNPAFIAGFHVATNNKWTDIEMSYGLAEPLYVQETPEQILALLSPTIPVLDPGLGNLRGAYWSGVPGDPA